MYCIIIINNNYDLYRELKWNWMYNSLIPSNHWHQLKENLVLSMHVHANLNFLMIAVQVNYIKFQ